MSTYIPMIGDVVIANGYEGRVLSVRVIFEGCYSIEVRLGRGDIDVGASDVTFVRRRSA